MTNPERYYQSSGDVNVSGAITVAGLGLIAAIVLGFIYGIVAYYNPFVYLSFLGAWFLGVGLGMVVTKAAVFGKLHNIKVTLGIGVLVGLVGLYAAWVGWLYVLNDYEYLMLNPLEILNFIQLAALLGVYEIFGWTPTGFALYAIWGIEAAIIIGGTVLNVMGGVNREPYCEDCGEWTKTEIITTRAKRITDHAKTVRALEAHDMSVLTGQALHNTTKALRADVLVHQCKTCSGPRYLSVHNVEVSYDDDGNAEEERGAIVSNLIINSSDYDEIKRWGNTPPTDLPGYDTDSGPQLSRNM